MSQGIDYRMQNIFSSARWKKYISKEKKNNALDTFNDKKHCTLCSKPLKCITSCDKRLYIIMLATYPEGIVVKYSLEAFRDEYGRPYCSYACHELKKQGY